MKLRRPWLQTIGVTLLVMSKGRIVAEFDPRTCTRDDVMEASGEHEELAASPHHQAADPNGAQS